MISVVLFEEKFMKKKSERKILKMTKLPGEEPDIQGLQISSKEIANDKKKIKTDTIKNPITGQPIEQEISVKKN